MRPTARRLSGLRNGRREFHDQDGNAVTRQLLHCAVDEDFSRSLGRGTVHDKIYRSLVVGSVPKLEGIGSNRS